MSEERTKELREASGQVVYSDAITSFLYQLMRDHLPAGVVEKLVREVAAEPEEQVFTNGWLAKYANNLAEELKNSRTNNLAKVLSEAFGDTPDRNVSENRPSFKTDEETMEERTEDSKKVIDTLVQSGQISQAEADEIKKEIDEFEKESATQASSTVYVGGGEPVKEGESVVITNDNPNLTFTKTE